MAASLCAYELSGQKYPALVNQSKVLVDKMTNAFVGVRNVLQYSNDSMLTERIIQNNQIPYGYVNWNEGTPVVGTTNIAEAGTVSTSGIDANNVLMALTS